MKKVLLFFALFMGLFATSWAYDFSAVSPSGHTLFYNIISDGVEVTFEFYTDAPYTNAPTGTLTIPSSVVYNGNTYSVIRIGYEAFYGCSGLTSVTIPNSVTGIDHHAFQDCSGLTSITIPNSVTCISDFAFLRCSGLTSITIPSSVYQISLGAFYGCTSLTTVNYNVTGWYFTDSQYPVFGACDSLSTVNIGENVTHLPEYFLCGCNSLTSITFEGRIPPIIGEYSFYGVPSNVSVTIPCGTLALYMSRLPSTWNNYTETTLSFAAQSADESMGTVQVLNEPTCTNPNAVLNAVPASGYRFDHWSTGSTQNPYSLTVTTDTVITAYFVSEGGTEGIEDINADGVNIYVKDGRIVVDGTTEEYSIYDITGRIVAHSHSAEVSSPLSCGVYLVKVGLRPARKVVVR